MKRSRGFTFLELLITVAIVGLLASIALPLSEMSAQRNKEEDLRRGLREIREALDAYKRASDEGRITRAADQSGYPPTLATLVEGVADTKSASGGKLYLLRRVPRDPLATDLSASPEATWGLRSYDSSPDAPRPGKDVFDVYSLNASVGLNGVPYKEW
ncbi:MAG TPA: type II secretion system protein [Burkholderiales bacterium]|nr:type II secretion system protein [Burkholderiales bacterium]